MDLMPFALHNAPFAKASVTFNLNLLLFINLFV